MKTKRTAPKKAKASATPTTPTTPTTPPTTTHASPKPVKSPVQPHELSGKDRAKLKDFLNKSDKPFSVKIVPATRKRKRASVDSQVQTDQFDDRLTVQYEVKPATNWESLRRYKKFTVGDESIAVGESILVKHNDSEERNVDPAEQWKARVLEVRALDSEHVYVRVSWLNRPEDLDGGRKAYHGQNELIPTNEMDIIDAMAVNGGLEVYHWDEEDDESEMPDPDEFFWRQTYDFANTKTFSALRLICRDQSPQNPDEMILQCSNKECRKWMHVKCIAEDALERAGKEQPTSAKKRKSSGSTRRKTKAKALSVSESCSAASHSDTVSAEVFIANTPKDHPAETTETVITGADGEKQSESVRCLVCGEEVE
ncbi:hypothetical protein LTR08_007987 [Meristemomyces frigidus]|nr:hypothetical protein LTR08_007987 [Meristemomyces frigidus]